MFFEKSWDQVTVADINQLVNFPFEEGVALDFKSLLPNSEKEWVRFLKAVCAFANTQGGTIFIGVYEKNSVASKIEGIEVENWERLRQIFIQKINSFFENPPSRIEFRQILLPSGKSVVVLEISYSLRGPHRIRVAEGAHIFVKRVEANNIEMSVEEIRTAMLGKDSWVTQAQKYKMDRIEKILSGNASPLLIGTPSIFIHLVPLGPRSKLLDFKDPSIRPAFSSAVKSYQDKLNLGVLFQFPEKLCRDGIYFRGELIPPHVQHLLITKEGQIEFAAFCGDGEDPKSITLSFWEKICLEVISYPLRILLQEQVNPPYMLYCSIVGVKNRAITTSNIYKIKTPNSLPIERYDLPGVEIESLSRDFDEKQITEYLKQQYQPMFDRIWNDLDIIHSPNSSY